MATKTFCIGNQKGGVGKTTTSVNLAAGLGRIGVKTLLVDLDPQANATSSLGYDKEAGKSLYDVLTGDNTDAKKKIIHTDRKNLSIIPGEVDMAAIEVELAQTENYLVKLAQALQPIKDSGYFDAIIMDCPPAIGMLSMNAMAAADHLIIALQAEYLALEGLSQILSVIDELNESNINPNLSLGGIVMTMFDVRTRLSNQVVHEVKSHFPEKIFSSLIPRSIRLSEAPSFGKTIFEYDSTSSGSVAYDKLAKEFAKRFALK